MKYLLIVLAAVFLSVYSQAQTRTPASGMKLNSLEYLQNQGVDIMLVLAANHILSDQPSHEPPTGQPPTGERRQIRTR